MNLSNRDDEFFGDDSGDAKGSTSGEQVGAGLSEAEAAAERQRFRTLGYHEAYNSCKEEMLQDGFQAGYQDTYEAAMRIGNMLGEVIMQCELGEKTRSQESSQPQPSNNVECSRERLVAKNISQTIRSFVLDPRNHGRLSELESRIKEVAIE
jgi:hypothetical protein